jgi:hypothetical protein
MASSAEPKRVAGGAVVNVRGRVVKAGRTSRVAASTVARYQSKARSSARSAVAVPACACPAA